MPRTPSCPVCGRWNEPSGQSPDSHSGGCPNTGQPYPGWRRPDPSRFVAVGSFVFDPDWEPVEVLSWDVYTVQP